MDKTQQGSQTAGSVVTLLLGLAMIGVVVGFWLFSRTPGGEAQIRAAAAPPKWESNCRGPVPDTFLPGSGAGPEAARALSPGRRGYLLVQIGACAKCLVDELTAWKRAAASRGFRMVLVTHAQTPPEDDYRDVPALRDLPLVTDKEGVLTRYFNSCFTPRAYVFKPNWSLLCFQAEADPPLNDPFADRGLRAAR